MDLRIKKNKLHPPGVVYTVHTCIRVEPDIRQAGYLSLFDIRFSLPDIRICQHDFVHHEEQGTDEKITGRFQNLSNM